MLPQLMTMLQQNYPSLFELFNQYPNLLVGILSGQYQTIQGGDQMEGEGEDFLGGDQPQIALTAEDEQNIQTVS